MMFKVEKLNYKIYLTIDGSQGEKALKLIKKIDQPELKPYIENLGKINFFNLEQFYSHFDGVILPSLLESYSSVYAEAMKFKLPLFVSDLNFNREICGKQAFYFNPFSAASIFQTILNVDFNNMNPRKHYDEIPSWPSLAEKIVNELVNLGYNNVS